MTLILGLICKDGIVLAADSQTTKGAAKQLGINKISVIEFKNGKAAVAESGSASLSNAAIHIFQNLARGVEIENELTVAKTAEAAIREVLAGITKHLNPNSPDKDRQDFLFQDVNYFELMVAYYFGNKPCLWILKSAWCIPVPFTSYFLTSGIAGDLANYILQEHTTPGMDATLAEVMAIKVVKDAIDYVEGCGEPIRVTFVTKPSRYKLVKRDSAGQIIEESEILNNPSDVHIRTLESVENIAKIISKVEQDTKLTRNKKIHQALFDEASVYLKKMEKEREDLRRDFPEKAAERAAKDAQDDWREVVSIPDNE